ncbi:MAG: protoheme IX farnesyltransferase [Actinobacteria bacterium]|nr:protoheme IX farnesyltransferase [Actinomycetota bacterium]
MQSFRGERVPWGSWRDYVALTKPRIMSLLLVTGFCGMIAGARGWPGTGTAVAAMAGLALACGGASALNHVLDRDIDPLMGERTKQRPVASGRVPASRALEFGLALSAFSFVLLASAVNVLTAVLALIGNLFYVLVYTRWLKRSTSQNIVIGGAAGAVPPLVGWAAATSHVGLAAWLLFAIVFVWTPPHFWALALLIKENYANAKVPMLPVVRGERETARQIVLYSIALVGVTLLPWAWGGAGPVYVVGALALGAAFLWLAERLRRDVTPRRAALLFHYSLLYLALLFAALALDSVL